MKNHMAFLAGLIGILAAAPAMADGQIHWSAADSASLRAHIEAGRYGTVTSVLVLHDGKTLFEGYFRGADARTLHDTRSVTKTLVSMAAGRAIEEGLVELGTPAIRFFGNAAAFRNPDPRKLAITVEDLLTMSSPLECDDWNQFSRGNEERMYLVEDWTSFFWNLPIRGYPAWTKTPADSPYGRAFSYCTAGVQILGEIIERASGTKFTRYVETRILSPLKIKAFKWSRNGTGQAHMGGGLRLTTRALAKLGELLRRHGRYDGQQILPSAWTQESVKPRAVIPNGSGWQYGYLWWLKPFEVSGKRHRAAAMNGNGGNRVLVLPGFGVTAVITKTDYNTPKMHDKTDAFMETEILARLSGG